MMDTPTQVKIKQHKLENVQQKLNAVGLTIVDKSDMDFANEQISTLTGIQNENRMLRAQLARALKLAKS